jgi:hypothetical protein
MVEEADNPFAEWCELCMRLPTDNYSAPAKGCKRRAVAENRWRHE